MERYMSGLGALLAFVVACSGAESTADPGPDGSKLSTTSSSGGSSSGAPQEEGDDAGSSTSSGSPALPDDAGTRTAAHLVYVRFEGAEVVGTNGEQPDESSENTSALASGTLPAFDASPYASYTRAEAIGVITARVRTILAPYDVAVVTERPASGEYTMALVGGMPADVGIQQRGLTGASYLDCDNGEDDNIVFAFAEGLAPTGDETEQHALEVIGSTVGHELGHSFGLVDVVEPTFVMYPFTPDGTTYGGSTNTSSPFGGDGTAPETCAGGSVQDSNAILLANLGAAQP